MLTRLHLKNFTVFADADFSFAPGLNVVVGENGTGKSHLLKAAYALQSVVAPTRKQDVPAHPTQRYLESEIARKLRAVFRPDELGRLVRRSHDSEPCEVEALFRPNRPVLKFKLQYRSQDEVAVQFHPFMWERKPPVFFPTRELMTIYPGFVSLYETTELPFEETWRDTCILLGAPLARGAKVVRIQELLRPLEEAMGGPVILDHDRFYVRGRSGDLEAHLVAEGMRKLAMLARLIANGSLVESGSLFWDEPEANLNPKILKRIARTILQLSLSGIQVVIATHSLFLMRELDILLRGSEFATVSRRFFGLHPGEAGVTVRQGEAIEDVGDIAALDEELNQSDRYLEAEAAQ
ncbi:AAA family ATPase [Aquisphaera insulae]|uniref:AAA family ATPase n=1 Tax=Aquisphaera insulae TaxID=2712864 RepID=UPI0013EA643A|nr:ATP-binding protein [Aquisphaera insulae]